MSAVRSQAGRVQQEIDWFDILKVNNRIDLIFLFNFITE